MRDVVSETVSSPDPARDTGQDLRKHGSCLRRKGLILRKNGSEENTAKDN
jgi:hypothetical protein